MPSEQRLQDVWKGRGASVACLHLGQVASVSLSAGCQPLAPGPTVPTEGVRLAPPELPEPHDERSKLILMLLLLQQAMTASQDVRVVVLSLVVLLVMAIRL